MTSAIEEQTKAKFVLEIMDHTGHSKVVWDPDDPAEVAAAEKAFNAAIAKKYAAFEMQPGGTQGKQIRKFDPYAGRILMCPPLAGG